MELFMMMEIFHIRKQRIKLPQNKKTDTAEIAKSAGVSTGIVYQYFKDKHDILIAGLERYSNDIFFPIFDGQNIKFVGNNIENVIKEMIDEFVKNHKLSKQAHEEITAMMHLDEDFAKFFYQKEIFSTNAFADMLVQNNINSEHLYEKVHIALSLIDNLFHEIIYHKHSQIDYEVIKNEVVGIIVSLLS